MILTYNKILKILNKKLCSHKNFEPDTDQETSSGFLVTITKKCSNCGDKFIFRKDRNMCWYNWSKL